VIKIMNLKRLTTIILVINLWLFIFGNIVLAYNCPRDDGHGVGCGDATKPYYCMSGCRSAASVPECPTYILGPDYCATSSPGCGPGCTGSDSCGICNSCSSSYLLCPGVSGVIGRKCASKVTEIDSHCSTCTWSGGSTFNCTGCAPGYKISGGSCVEVVLKLGHDSVSANNTIIQSAANTLMYISRNEVSVGTSSSVTGTKLYIYDAVSGPIIALSGSDSNYRGLAIKDTGDAEKWFIGNNTSTNFVLRQNGSTDLLTVLSSGNVGVGTTTPSAKLDVNGSLAVRGAVSFTDPTLYIGTSSRFLIVDSEGNVSATTTTGGGGGGSDYVLKGGDMMTGTLRFETSTVGVAIDAGYNNIIAVNKLSVVIIDPLYNIGGVKYSSYAPSIVGGAKEEYVGRGNIKDCGSEFCSWILDFSQVSKGSDLWVWRQIIDFHPETIEVIMTAYGKPALLSYEIGDNQIKFYSDRPTQFSYRLVGSRFDWRRWPTLAPDQSESTSLIIK